MSKPKPIVKEAFVAEKLREDIGNGLIKKYEELVERILFHDSNICKQLGIEKKYKSKKLDKSTLYRFLKKFDIPKVRELKKNSKKSVTVTNISDDDNDNSTLAITENSNFEIEAKSGSSLTSHFEKFVLKEESKDDNQNNIIIHYQGEKIKELTKICTGLSNKIPPSSLLSVHAIVPDSELEKNRTLHLCIRALIQVLSPIKQITEWIIENDFLIVQGITSEDPFQQLANTWFWNGILKYESLGSNHKFEILKRFGDNFKYVCEKHDKIFGTKFLKDQKDNLIYKQLFIPPPPQKILDILIQQHYNHFIDELPNGDMQVLPNLPFKKIELRPPLNTKPFGKVSFCSWRPSLFSSPIIHQNYGVEEDHGQDEEKEADILFAELTWDKDKLTYVHFAWPQYEEDVILEKGWHYFTSDGNQEIKKTQSDYEMIGVIWGKQFCGEWPINGRESILPHLGLDKSPLTYIYATKRNTNVDNYKQGRWYLSLDDNYISHFKPKELTNNFQDVLLYMDNDHRRSYRPQLLVFQKLQPPFDNTFDDGHGRRNREESSSPVSFESYEPNIKKKKIWIEDNYLQALDESHYFANHHNCLMNKKYKEKDLKRKKSIPRLLRKHNAQLTSKKQVIEIIDDIINACPSNIVDDDKKHKFFAYDKSSDYPKGRSGFQITQTHDQKGYNYVSLNNSIKR
jgi:hypothetical protein